MRPLFSLALRPGRVGEVAVDVEVAQVQVDLGPFDKTRFLGCGGQRRTGQRDGDQAGEKYCAVEGVMGSGLWFLGV